MGSREPYPPAAPDAVGGAGAAPARRRGRLRAIALRLALLLFGCVLALLLAEVVTRLLSDEGPAWTFRDPVVGRRFTRSWEGKAWVEEAGRAVHLSFNREGMRDRDGPEERTQATARVAVLGDSMVAALATDAPGRFTELLHQDPSLGRHEVQNWGVAGSSPAWALRLLQERVGRHRPDVVVLCWFAGNDLSDDWQPLGGRREAWLDLDAQGQLVERPFDGSASAASEWLARHSRFYVWQRRMLARLRASGDEPALRPGLRAFADPGAGEVQRAWTMQEGVLSAFRSVAASFDAEVLLVLLPCAEQVYDDLWERTRERAGAEGLVLVREHLPARLAAAAAVAGLPLLDLTEAFRRAAPAHALARVEEHLFLGGTGHLNDAGHRVVAQALAAALRPMLGGR